MRPPVVVGAMVVLVLHGPGPARAGPGLENGEELFEMICATCHAVDAAKGKKGPPLEGLFGRVSGTQPGFAYSPAMRAAKVVWSVRTLDAFLAKPRRFIPGQKMVFGGLSRARDRADVIAYLKKILRVE